MTRIRLLPVVILLVTALLVLKTVGLVTQGGYALLGTQAAMAAGGAPAAEASTGPATLTQPTAADTAPTITDTAPTVGGAPAAGDHGAAPAAEAGHGEAAPATDAGHGEAAPADAGHGEVPTNSVAAANACAAVPVGEGSAGGQLLVVPPGCPVPTDALPQVMTPGGVEDLASGDTSLTEQVLLQRLAARRTELEAYEQELTMRASLVDAAEKRIEERQQTLQDLEAQIAALVDQRQQLEDAQIASLVSMYGAMKPKDAALIFDTLELDVLFRVSKAMSPRKLAPILAEMSTARAQELTIALASETPPVSVAEQMTPDNLAALPQIVGQ